MYIFPECVPNFYTDVLVAIYSTTLLAILSFLKNLSLSVCIWSCVFITAYLYLRLCFAFGYHLPYT